MSIDEETHTKVANEIESHLDKIRVQRDRFEELMEGLAPDDGPFDWRHTENVANRLESFYNGVERIFERIAKEVDGGAPRGDRWHKSLLRQMKESKADRPPVIDNEQYGVLLKYLNFRHFYRQGYSVDIQ